LTRLRDKLASEGNQTMLQARPGEAGGSV
jgi:hypothetical protein